MTKKKLVVYRVFATPFHFDGLKSNKELEIEAEKIKKFISYGNFIDRLFGGRYDLFINQEIAITNDVEDDKLELDLKNIPDLDGLHCFLYNQVAFILSSALSKQDVEE